jgi:hypothetical protein
MFTTHERMRETESDDLLERIIERRRNAREMRFFTTLTSHILLLVNVGLRSTFQILGFRRIKVLQNMPKVGSQQHGPILEMRPVRNFIISKNKYPEFFSSEDNRIM